MRSPGSCPVGRNVSLVSMLHVPLLARSTNVTTDPLHFHRNFYLPSSGEFALIKHATKNQEDTWPYEMPLEMVNMDRIRTDGRKDRRRSIKFKAQAEYDRQQEQEIDKSEQEDLRPPNSTAMEVPYRRPCTSSCWCSNAFSAWSWTQATTTGIKTSVPTFHRPNTPTQSNHPVGPSTHQRKGIST
jgi:hypothetical protein